MNDPEAASVVSANKQLGALVFRLRQSTPRHRHGCDCRAPKE